MTGLRGYAGVAGDVRQSDRRRRLIHSAMDRLIDGGPAAITVTAVCKAAGLTPRYFYEHFANRDELLDAMVEHEAGIIIETARTATLAAGGTPADRAAAGVESLLDLFAGDPRAVRINRERGQDELVLRLRAALTTHLTAAMIENADAVWPGPHAHPERLPLACALTMGGVVQLLVEWLEGASQLSRRELIQMIADFTLATGAVVLGTT